MVGPAMAFPRQVPHIPRLSEFHELREDVVYAHADGVPLRFDHYRPRKVEGPAPAVIFIHGGAWMHGDPSQAAGNALHFARRGIATVSLSYRLAPAHRFPAPLDDVRHGLRWVRAHAGELGIHGTADTIVSYRQSVRMHEALVAAGKAAELLLLESAPHAFQIDWRGEANRRANEAMDAFLERHLRTEP